MSTDISARNSSGAASRIADTLLRVVGGREVALRVLTQSSGGDGGQLGQPSPLFQDYTLEPVVFRRVQGQARGSRDSYEVLISSTAITNLLALLPTATPDGLIQSAVGIVVDGELRTIEGIRESEAFGAVYLYTLSLRDE